MLGKIHWRITVSRLVATILALVLAVTPCVTDRALAARFDLPSGDLRSNRSAKSDSAKLTKLSGKIAETSPPSTLQALGKAFENYQPQVAILSPKPNEILSENTVVVRFQVKDLPIFKDAALELGPHLHVFLDNQPYRAVYDLNQPLVLDNLEPGTHTLRVFASRPWHESFKNEGAYAQTTFHIFTKTQDNSPDPALPLLTYSRPQGSYGAEPIMLDFYLTNAPLHLVAQESDKDDIPDWRIRCTVNGNSFLLDRWHPIYLKGFKPGKNWVQLEFLDEQGNPVKNAFNNTVRLITYEPDGKDTLSKLVRGDLSAESARGIVDPTYVPAAPPPEPEPESAPTPEPTPIVPETPRVEITPTPAEEPALPSSPELPAPVPGESTAPEQEPPQAEPPQPAQPTPSKPGFFNRFRPPFRTEKPAPTPTPSPVTEPEPISEPTPAATESPEPLPSPQPDSELETPLEETPQVTPPAETPAVPKARTGFFDRFRRSTPAPSASPEASQPIQPAPDTNSSPESIPTEISPAPTAAEPAPVINAPELAPSPIPSELEAPAEAEPEEVIQATEPSEVKEPLVKERAQSPRFKPSFFDRFRRTAAPSVEKPSAPEPKTAEPPALQPSESPESADTPATSVEPGPSPAEKPAPAEPDTPPAAPGAANRDRINQMFERLRRQTNPSPSAVPPTPPLTLPEITDSAPPEMPIPVEPSSAPAADLILQK